MHTFQPQELVGSIVARHPALSRVFERAGIDYCCGGKRTLEEACRCKGIDTEEILSRLNAANKTEGDEAQVASMSLSELANHIESVHHAYLRAELPRLDAITAKVASVHGESEPRLKEIRSVFESLMQEICAHMLKEEQVLFPMVRALESGSASACFTCGTLEHPIRQMEHEHEWVGNALQCLRRLSGDYTPPDWACNTYRAMLDGLAHLERDFHQHIHKENNVLFPRASELEGQRRA